MWRSRVLRMLVSKRLLMSPAVRHRWAIGCAHNHGRGAPEVLKTKLMHEDVLEVACERPQDAMEEIRKLAGIKEVALFGKCLHVVADDGEAAVRRVKELLPQSGFDVERIEKIVPSLEDVFVSLVEARDQAAGSVQEVKQ